MGPGIDALFRVLKNGFIPSLNDSFHVGLVIDPLFHLGWQGGAFLSLATSPYVQWRFGLLKLLGSGELSVFANLGAGIWFWVPDSLGNCHGCHSVDITGFPLFQLGANFFFTRNIGLRVIAGYPSASIGITVGF